MSEKPGEHDPHDAPREGTSPARGDVDGEWGFEPSQAPSLEGHEGHEGHDDDSPAGHDAHEALASGEPAFPGAPAGRGTGATAAAAPEPLAGWERGVLEKLAFAALEEQRAARRWRLINRVFWLIIVLVGAWVVIDWDAVGSAPSTPHTAMVSIHGEIAADTEASADLIVAAARAAFEDSSAQAVVLLIDSPGGSPVQAGIINDEIRRLKALHNKPVYAVVEETCASAAYYIAVSADKIFVDKASIVGSIGVLMDGFGFTGLMDKLGVERRLLTAGENKGMLDPFSPMTERQRAYAQAMLDQIHQQFISVVRQGRGSRLKETPDIFSGLFWTGQQAISLGLADQLGNLDFVAREIVKAEDVVDYTRHPNVAERLVKRFGAAMGEGAVRALRASPGVR